MEESWRGVVPGNNPSTQQQPGGVLNTGETILLVLLSREANPRAFQIVPLVWVFLFWSCTFRGKEGKSLYAAVLG